jgi:hypothetical protein
MEFMASHSFASFADTTDSSLAAEQRFLVCILWRVRSAAMWSSLRPCHQFWMTTQPNKSPEPTAVGAGSSAVAVHVASRRWLSFFR